MAIHTITAGHIAASPSMAVPARMLLRLPPRISPKPDPALTSIRSQSTADPGNGTMMRKRCPRMINVRDHMCGCRSRLRDPGAGRNCDVLFFACSDAPWLSSAGAVCLTVLIGGTRASRRTAYCAGYNESSSSSSCGKTIGDRSGEP